MSKLKNTRLWITVALIIFTLILLNYTSPEGFQPDAMPPPVSIGQFSNATVERKGIVFTAILDNIDIKSFGQLTISLVSYPDGKLLWNTLQGGALPKSSVKAQYALIICSKEAMLTREQVSDEFNRLRVFTPAGIDSVEHVIILDGTTLKLEDGSPLPFIPQCPKIPDPNVVSRIMNIFSSMSSVIAMVFR